MKADFVGEILLTEMQLRTSVEAVPSLRGGGGGGGGRAPTNDCMCPPILVYSNYCVWNIT